MSVNYNEIKVNYQKGNPQISKIESIFSKCSSQLVTLIKQLVIF